LAIGAGTTLDKAIVSSDISVMTEIAVDKKIPLAIEQFILHWGDMGGQWGVNRSVSQIHALLYLSERPLTADEIAERLGLARSNVSNSIKELLAWDLITRVPIKGDRREHYEAEIDVWEIFSRIAAGRKQREIDPAIAALRTCVKNADDDARIHPVARKRLGDLLEFVEAMDRWYAQMQTVPKSSIATLIRLGAKIVKLLSLGERK
jgi:DNA-binding transcriptional regulator GbsR (MarR family)